MDDVSAADGGIVYALGSPAITNAKGTTVKLLTSVLVAACLMAGCVAGSTVPHDDSPGSVKRDEGPVLCRDGTTPPCNDRD